MHGAMALIQYIRRWAYVGLEHTADTNMEQNERIGIKKIVSYDGREGGGERNLYVTDVTAISRFSFTHFAFAMN